MPDAGVSFRKGSGKVEKRRNIRIYDTNTAWTMACPSPSAFILSVRDLLKHGEVSPQRGDIVTGVAEAASLLGLVRALALDLMRVPLLIGEAKRE